MLIVEGDEALQSAVTERFAANGLRVGRTDGKATSLGGERRHMGSADLPLRVMSLLLDPACDALVARATVAELERHGIPHVRFNTALIAAADEIPLRLRELIAAQVGDILNLDSEAKFGPEHATA